MRPRGPRTIRHSSTFLEELFENLGLSPGENWQVWLLIHSFFYGFSWTVRCFVSCYLPLPGPLGRVCKSVARKRQASEIQTLREGLQYMPLATEKEKVLQINRLYMVSVAQFIAPSLTTVLNKKYSAKRNSFENQCVFH